LVLIDPIIFFSVSNNGAIGETVYHLWSDIVQGKPLIATDQTDHPAFDKAPGENVARVVGLLKATERRGRYKLNIS